jgi:hypothetical protein
MHTLYCKKLTSAGVVYCTTSHGITYQSLRFEYKPLLEPQISYCHYSWLITQRGRGAFRRSRGIVQLVLCCGTRWRSEVNFLPQPLGPTKEPLPSSHMETGHISVYCSVPGHMLEVFSGCFVLILWSHLVFERFWLGRILAHLCSVAVGVLKKIWRLPKSKESTAQFLYY